MMTTEQSTTIHIPRLVPIEHSKSWRWRRFGKIIAPMKVIHARLPLDDVLTLLGKTHVASLNGCSFCDDIAPISPSIAPGL